ncbi:helix-turn-helix transcriptional regulator [Ruegeria arenilitoris]|uniref:helix-turn-helix transcriptional regulator n=1 Tax=Ruegeria arenilitoris TaxID=1173585 RepID=UPI001C2C6AD6|nr:AlpA family phage regulatory protein [Ruegeria arenilitoris]
MTDQVASHAVMSRLGVDRASKHQGETPWMKHAFVKPQDDRLLGLPEVKDKVGLGRSAIYERIRENTFPAPGADKGRSLWSLREITAWQQWRLAQRGGAYGKS